MKKLLGAVLAAALLFPPGPASAELLKNLKLSGELDVQTNAGRNISDFATRQDNTGGTTNNDRIGNAQTRLLVNLGWDVLDDVHANVTLRKNDRDWGSAGHSGQAAGAFGGSAGAQPITGDAPGVLDNIYLQQANVKIDKLLGYVDTTVGRQYYGDPGDLIIYFGPKDNYGLFVTAVDAARFDISNDWMNFSGLAGKLKGANVTAALPQADTNLRGFDIGWKNLPIKINTFVWNSVVQGSGALGTPPTEASGTTGLNDFLWVYGLKLHGEAMGGWITGTVAANSGTDRTTLAAGGCGAAGCTAVSSNYEGKALLVDAGWKGDVTNVAAFIPWANFGWGSGRSSNMEAHNEGFNSIASDYRPGIINGFFNPVSGINLGSGLPGIAGTGIGTNGLNNRVIWGAGLKVKPSMWEKLTVGASVWDYRMQRNTFVIAGGTFSPNGNLHLGTEFGLTADWKHSDNVNVGVGWATFQPGGFVNGSIAGVAAGRGVDPATLAFADLTIKW